jgi:molybdopterin synthase catalytic subunit
MQTVRVRVFARFRDVFGTEIVELRVPDMATIRDIRSALSARNSEIAALLARSQFAVNNEFVGDQTPIAAEDEIALIPPVSGG